MLKSTGSDIGVCISVFLSVCTAMIVFSGLMNIYSKINVFTSEINEGYIKLIIKVIGISYVTEISSNICKENGFSALASIMEIYARISIVGMCLPVVITLFQMVSQCLS
ncbi:MAG: stage III sporulation AC/AD family protein [Lachnospira sp.]|nr:stage III sporulation AC/AD family protein [Lachnospira sp.]